MNLMELQGKIFKSGLDAFIVTKHNCFIGQRVLPEEDVIFQLTKFSGSKATLLCFSDKAYLFVDGRYDIQARQEVDLEKVEVVVAKKHAIIDFLVRVAKDVKKLKVGYNSWCFTIKEVDDFLAAAADKMPNVKFIDSNLMLPAVNNKEPLVFEHAVEFAGKTRAEKIAMISKTIELSGLDAYFVAAADSVSWLLNIRSNLLPDTPIVRAFALINKEHEVLLFSDNIDYNLKFKEKVKILPLGAMPKEMAKYKKKTIGACMYATPAKIFDVLSGFKINYRSVIDPCQCAKAEKNDIELAGMKMAHVRDGVALAKLMYWLGHDHKPKTEMDVAERLSELRSVEENYFSESFETIAGFGANAAIVHYRSSEETNKEIKSGNVLLLDSGAQYLDGTTDVTRTIAIGEPSQEMIDSYTEVLKAHIALAETVFPENLGGMVLDVIARSKMWKFGKDYGHGTGHGVGHFLNVHEGPISISSGGTQYGFKEGMVTSIEPGYYKENEFGIRIENLYYTKKVIEDFLAFEVLTLVPLDKKLINRELLNKEEILWINNYHKKVYVALANHLTEEERVWLETCCFSI